MVAAVAGVPRIRDRAVSIAAPMGGQEFPTTTSGFLGAQSLIIPSQIGKARRAGGVIRSQARPIRLHREIGRRLRVGGAGTLADLATPVPAGHWRFLAARGNLWISWRRPSERCPAGSLSSSTFGVAALLHRAGVTSRSRPLVGTRVEREPGLA